MSDQGTGHESGAKVRTAPVHPQDQMAGDVAGGVAKQTQMGWVAKPKPPGPRYSARFPLPLLGYLLVFC